MNDGIHNLHHYHAGMGDDILLLGILISIHAPAWGATLLDEVEKEVKENGQL